MKFGLLFRTVRHLRWRQVFWQVMSRVRKVKYVCMEAPVHGACRLRAVPIPRYVCRDGERFCFLNVEDVFHGWNDTSHGMLWAYNLNYFDFLNQGNCQGSRVKGQETDFSRESRVEGQETDFSQESRVESQGVYWIDRFIGGIGENRIGLDAYPTALRCINWVKFFCRFPECATKVREDSLYSQLVLLSRKPEYHLLGNHLLEDAYSLYFCSAYFEDERLLSKARKLLFGELAEQVLPDGAHYEQSAMYHCILLDRLLDCYNMALSRGLAADANVLRGYAVRMLGHLESIVYVNGDIPLMNDAARGIAPEASAIFDYGKRLGLEWSAIPLNECGYRKLSDGDFEVLIDAGEIAASYQPGHSHADVLNYELRIGGVPVVVDTGISTYDKCPRRQYERSGAAHNVVTVCSRSSAEVWGGFRVGYRYSCKPVGENSWEVCGYGDGTKVRRTFSLAAGVFCVEDSTDSNEECISFIHVKGQGSRVESQETDFSQGSRDEGQETVVVLDSGRRIEIWGATKVEIKGERTSQEYNIFEEIDVIELHFVKGVRYKIL